MKVFITGATGVLGTRLVDELTNRGHDAVGLVRDHDGAQLVEQRGGTPANGDLFDVDSLADAAGNADVVVHAATSLPTTTKTDAEDWEQNDRVRVDGAKTALDAAARVDADQFLTHTVVWAFRNEDGSPIDHDAAPNTDRDPPRPALARWDAVHRFGAGGPRRGVGTGRSCPRYSADDRHP